MKTLLLSAGLLFPLATLSWAAGSPKVDLTPTEDCSSPYPDPSIKYLDTAKAKRFEAYANAQEFVASGRFRVQKLEMAVGKKKMGERFGFPEAFYSTDKSQEDLETSLADARRFLAEDEKRLSDLDKGLTDRERNQFKRRDTESLWVVLEALLKKGSDYEITYSRGCVH